jgi:hypothetical protein
LLLISLHEMGGVEGLSNPETQKVGKSFASRHRPEKAAADWVWQEKEQGQKPPPAGLGGGL